MTIDFFIMRSRKVKIEKISKVYDCISWDFLEKSMQCLGFSKDWISKLMTTVRTTSYSLLINGQEGRRFGSKRGVRQGDPLSPYLFIMAMEMVSRGWKSQVLHTKIALPRAPRAMEKISSIMLCLIKHNLQSLPVFWMQSVCLPRATVQKLEASMARFLWADNPIGTHKYRWKAWSTLCRPKEEGGVGLKKLEAMNASLLAKRVCQLVNSNSLAWNWCKNRYLGSVKSLWSLKRPWIGSYYWKSLGWAWTKIEDKIVWTIEDGQSALFWLEKWGDVLLKNCIQANDYDTISKDFHLNVAMARNKYLQQSINIPLAMTQLWAVRNMAYHEGWVANGAQSLYHIIWQKCKEAYKAFQWNDMDTNMVELWASHGLICSNVVEDIGILDKLYVITLITKSKRIVVGCLKDSDANIKGALSLEACYGVDDAEFNILKWGETVRSTSLIPLAIYSNNKGWIKRLKSIIEGRRKWPEKWRSLSEHSGHWRPKDDTIPFNIGSLYPITSYNVGEPNHKPWWVFLVISVICLVLLAAACALCLLRVRKRHLEKQKYNIEADDNHGNATEKDADYDLPQITLRAIQDATDNLSEANKLGEGVFGPVYMGKLPDGQEVAVKRSATASGQGLREFRNEVQLIAKLEHTNLVRLIGCRLEKGEKLLVYEYMPNKSLDYFLKELRERLACTHNLCACLCVCVRESKRDREGESES
ncbi:putative L-type lectin-domain containing receptor kinase S-5 [Nymphaea thermarum]|nr:putative L-type lectin-domain containing receptor kinase S-5 [Nymphaea thermarum]